MGIDVGVEGQDKNSDIILVPGIYAINHINVCDTLCFTGHLYE